MERNLVDMSARSYDLLVIGGGIYGVCVAWDAAQRGLSVALLEQAEFGQATSANSLKTLHGGLRYLQEANLPRMRLMARERRSWMRIAPHLTRPLPFLLPTAGGSPTGGKLTRHKLLMRAALAVNDWVSFDRNQGVLPGNRLPKGRILSRSACLALVPGLPDDNLSGGALWYDAQLLDHDALLWALLQAAVAHGAHVAGHAPVSGFLQRDRRIHGAVVTDRMGGELYEVQAALVVNCAGAWSDGLLCHVNGRAHKPTFHLSTAINLVTRQILPEVAVGLPSLWQGRRRILFMAPWQDCSLIGTWHAPYSGDRPAYQVDEATIDGCLAEVNAAYPPARLTRSDLRQVHAGYLPMRPGSSAEVRLVRESVIHDHARTEKIDGLLSVIGVKYTTARHTAEHAVDLALRKLGRDLVPCQTAHTDITRYVKTHSVDGDVADATT